MSNWNVSRRSFMGAAAASRLRAASDPIKVGLIGVGGRGTYNLGEIQRAKDTKAVVTGICDVWRPNRERAAAQAEKAFGVKPRLTTDYRELLSWKEVDAVVIATPDFTHSRMLQHAVEAGKDVYCEKPMGTVFAEAKSAYLVVKNSKQVVQIGTQRRSEGRYIQAARLVQSGLLGQVTRVDMSVNFYEPRWRRDYADVKAEDVDWKQFLFGGPARPFDPRLLRQWQLFRATTNGIAGLWMCHYIDQVHWFLDDPYPAGAVANGGVYFWKDGRETSDVFHALLDYPKGFLVSFSMSLTNSAGNRNTWHGTLGTLDIEKWTISGEGSKDPKRVPKEIQVADEPASSHMQNWLDCIRTRQTPRADIQAGFSHAVACCMAAEALLKGRRIRFDRARLEIL